ncbi:putative dehydrogenase [Paenarthrobacter nitroguajacolicus]|uniref:Gfo/Idh/MocA family protein n=1 Tax=Paenarthrobacter nitroguajacolicus TaxID=211146 RepID=UPI002856BC82|nr:Gfo/Idh/MocA family oxidoreductase [Paenarthrobacter nitroguajacolicus]MDR6989154.1 putative dehydrogenase [Paenarthrobacter nitroguajacolicus]
MEPIRVGIIGVGNVLNQYLDKIGVHPDVDIVALADVNPEAVRKRAAEYDVPKALTPDELLADKDVELVLNLTPPKLHAPVTLKAIAAGKHVLSEKPFATTLEEAKQILDAARQAGVKVGTAPTTFLGSGQQTSRKLIDDGWIGRPVAAFASFACRGYEHWHPNVDPFYSPGAGPMLDIGPYLITNLVNIFGPAKRVTATAQRSSKTRPRPAKDGGYDGVINIETPTHVTGTIEFATGAVATVIVSWDVWNHNLPHFEIYGTDGSIATPNTDFFWGAPLLRRGEPGDLALDMTPPGGGDWRETPITHRDDAYRGIGLAEFGYAIRTGVEPRTGGEFAYHCLEILLAFEISSERGQHVAIESTCERPRPLPSVGPLEPYRFD